MFPDKAKLISLLIAALAFGTLLLLNLDRSIHASNQLLASPNSAHGWPLVYLVRESNEFSLRPELAHGQLWAWPWPPIETETRTISWMNATTDIIVGASIVVIVFMMTHTVSRRFTSSSDI